MSHSSMLSSKWTRWAVTLGLPAMLFLIPVTETFTPQLRMFFAITAFFIIFVCFGFTNVLLPSLLVSALYIISGIAPAGVALSSWTNLTVYMVIGAFAIANALEECGLLKRVAIRVIQKCGGTYNGTLYGMYIIGCVLAVMTFNNHWLVIIAFAYGIVKAFNFQPFSREASLIMFSSAIGASAMGPTLYNPFSVGLLESGMKAVMGADYIFPWYLQTLQNWPFLFVPVIVIWILTRMYHTREFNSKINHEYFRTELERMGPMSVKEKKACVILAVLLAYLLLQPLHKLPIPWGFMIIPWFMWAPGVEVATDKSLKGIGFGFIAFLASCMSIGVVGVHLGINNFVTATLGTMLGNMGAWGLSVFTLIFGTAANIVLTPAAIFSTLMVPLGQAALSGGINPEAIAITLMNASDVYFLPHEVSCMIVLFSFGMMSMRQFIVYSTVKSLIMIAFFMTVSVTYWIFNGFLFI